MDSLTILWVLLSVLSPRLSAVVPGVAGAHASVLSARLLYLENSGSPCSFDSSRPAASDDDNTGDEDDSGGNAAGYAALRSSVSVAALAPVRTYLLPGRVPYLQRSVTRQLSSRAPPF